MDATAHLTHPNIVRAYDSDWAGDVPFLVLEYVLGANLDQKLAEVGRLGVATACDYARQTALGLPYAYLHHMVHRDIKPHNLMLTPEEQVKILDFGLALRQLAAGTPPRCGIMGVGATRRLSSVRWGIAREVVLAWVLTIPGAALAGCARLRTGPRRDRQVASIRSSPVVAARWARSGYRLCSRLPSSTPIQASGRTGQGREPLCQQRTRQCRARSSSVRTAR